MRYVVTGGAGFIGSNTVDELVRRGESVVVLDDLSAGKEDNLAESRNKVSFIKSSINDIEAVRRSMHEADYVIHLAARTSVPRSVKDPLESNRVNIEGTLNVLMAARDAKVKRIVLAASSSAYGETPTLPKVETMQPNPISPYGVTKYACELYGQVFGRVYGLQNVSLRYFNVFGHGRIPARPIPAYCPNFARPFSRAANLWCTATANKLATSPTLTTSSRPRFSRAKPPPQAEGFLTSAPASAFPSIKRLICCAKSAATSSQQSMTRRETETFAIQKPM